MGDFIKGFTAGANIEAQRQELMLRRRAQEAQAALQEREWAAQAQMLKERADALTVAQQQRVKDQNDLAAANVLFKQNLDKFGGDQAKAMAQTLPPLALTNPKLAETMAMSYQKVQSAQQAQETLTETKRHNQAMEARPTSGTVLKVNPDGSTELIQGPGAIGPDQLTKANMSKVQENQANALATVDVANRLEPLINERTVGARAFAESWINDRVLAQAFPDMASDERANAETLAARLRATAVKELRSDGNITEGERKQILSAVPSINDPVDSPARARKLVRQIRTMSAIHAMVAAKRMGGAVPKAAALALDDEELLRLLDEGMITPQQSKDAYKIKHSQ